MRRVGQKGQIVIPKVIREFLAVGPGDAVILEVRGREVLIRPRVEPVEFVEDFCLTGGGSLAIKSI